jgi:hypothetical protein
LPQVPQLAGSSFVSTHLSLQSERPVPQKVVHVEEVQTSPAPQLFPHEPQFFGSSSASTHSLPHWIVPPLQNPPHEPAEQSSPDPHAFPHPPQFEGLSVVSTQTPPHLVNPPAQEPLVSSIVPCVSKEASLSVSSPRPEVSKHPGANDIANETIESRTSRCIAQSVA